MKEKIITRAAEMFLKYGFKSITMDDIANDMGISKKTIYKYFINKEVLIAESTQSVHQHVIATIAEIGSSGYNPVEENFQIRNIFEGIFQAADASPLYQLKKHYPEIYQQVIDREEHECFQYMRHNIEKGIAQGYYRSDVDIENSMRFYWTLIMRINETTMFEKDAKVLELAALIYHTRAIGTPKGVAELEKQLAINT
ncbi:TetR/AcrR family transcriptional regulator [Flavobacterium selenitireducens]|uniref:TetR/AcrR family transcriptional regulator n=1 Tax=Flavobacterium selenitireducens TaxID=2722704 RepID=UPI00168B6965|nr:TetR/AcrR family transcriptional regulator [Flavobacterium selenitireducens]MBD3581858.1 TetR/AcrR family transcriptional regulator [Flavobacterium selenitireducens]